MKLSIIIPVYNEVETVKEVIKKIQFLQLPVDKEIIVIDDGSNDGTADVVKKLGESNIKILLFNRNRGKGAAVREGYSQASGDIIMIQDADLELDPEEIIDLLIPILEENKNVVYGNRFHKGNKNKGSLLFYLGNKFLVLITNMLFWGGISDMETCYKMLKRKVLEKLELKSNRFDIEPEITAKILKNGFKIYDVPISYNPRKNAKGKKINWKDGFFALWVLIKIRLGLY
ncbi:glycosyltransferase family 2 protein [Candidatus Dependentiae bacterium]|nr:glycosyltransferase family 2 protein [Candidatus Dependentiae bacterium]